MSWFPLETAKLWVLTKTTNSLEEQMFLLITKKETIGSKLLDNSNISLLDMDQSSGSLMLLTEFISNNGDLLIMLDNIQVMIGILFMTKRWSNLMLVVTVSSGVSPLTDSFTEEKESLLTHHFPKVHTGAPFLMTKLDQSSKLIFVQLVKLGVLDKMEMFTLYNSEKELQ